MKTLLGIDVGTSGLKAVLVAEDGSIMRTATRAYPLSQPQPGWSEQNPDDWWRACQECIAELDCSDVVAIGLTGQMHGSVFLNSDGKVIRPALLWNDQRTSQECDEIKQCVGEERIADITFGPPLTGYQLPKILWLRNNELSSYQEVNKILLPKDFIRFRLSGFCGTDVSDASGTGAFDIGARTWSSEIFQAMELNPDWFPQVSESSEIASATAAGIAIVAGAGDQAAAAVSTGTISEGVVSISLGTSGVAYACCSRSELLPNPNIQTFCDANRGWHKMGVMLSCGGAIQWANQLLFATPTFDAFDQAASACPPGAEGVRFLPYLTGERCPHNDPNATGMYFGLTVRHSRENLARATLEGVCFALKDCVEAIGQHQPAEVRLTGGGAKSRVWVQILSDVLGAPIRIVSAEAGPAYGAALLGGVGVGILTDLDSATNFMGRTSELIEPTGTSYADFLQNWRSMYPKFVER